MVLLIGNYAPDRQQSMLRFGAMMLAGLTNAGIAAELIQPAPRLGRFRLRGSSVAKWLAYFDKFVLFPMRLRRALAARPAIVHICDHSNAMYAEHVRDMPVVVTCHDLLAVRGGLGEETDCPASRAGRLLQRWILRGLRRATAVACVSRATLVDAQRLLGGRTAPKLELLPIGLSFPYGKQPDAVVAQRLAEIPNWDSSRPFVLHVGSNLRRKNRGGVLRIFARGRERWDGALVFVGEKLTHELWSLAASLGIRERVRDLGEISDEQLEALYQRATALLFPSRFEGFGWPIIEAQACGCPVICSNTGPMPEVAGAAGILCDVEDEAGFGEALLGLTNQAEWEYRSALGLENAKRFAPETMIARYLDLYRTLSPQL